MGFIRKNLLRTRKEKISTDSDFKTTVENICKDGGSGTYHLYRKIDEGAPKWRIIGDGEVKDLRDTDPEHWIRTYYGGGDYQLRLDKLRDKGAEEVVKTFNYYIEGEPKEIGYEVTRRKDRERSEMADIFKLSMEFAKDLKGGDGGNSALIQALITQNTALQTQNGQNMLEMQKHNDNMMMEMQKRNDALMLELRRDKEAGGNLGEMIENMKEMEEFKSMLVPKMEQNETIELVRAVSPMLTALIAGKMGAQPQEEQVRMIGAARPGETQDTNLVPPSNGRTKLGAPPPANRGTPSGTKEATPSELKLPNGTKIERDEFEIVMLDPLVDQINAGASPQEIALMIKTIIDWSFWRVKSGVEPHPAIIGMVTALAQASQGKADFEAIGKAYDDFAKLVEMPQELVDPVKQELLGIYGPIFLEMQKPKAGGVEDESPAE